MIRRRPASIGPLACVVIAAALVLAGCSGSITASGTSSGSSAGTAANRSATTPVTKTDRSSPAPGKTVDTTRLERAIARSAAAQRHFKADVTCPPEIPVRAGSQFYCAAQSGGEVTPFLVTEHTGGRLTYKGVPIARAPSVDMPVIEIDIAQRVRTEHKTARSVLCPQEMPRQQGLTFLCQVVTGAGKPARFVVTEVNGVGRVSLRAL